MFVLELQGRIADVLLRRASRDVGSYSHPLFNTCPHPRDFTCHGHVFNPVIAGSTAQYCSAGDKYEGKRESVFGRTNVVVSVRFT